MKRIYDFSRNPAKRNYTISDLQALKGTGKKLSMANPANAPELRACIEAGIDLFVVGGDQIDEVREIAPHHFTGVGSSWAQFGSTAEILDHAFEMMRKGGDLYYTLRSFETMETLAREGIPVQSHIGLIPTFSHYCGGLRAWGRKADEAMQIFETLKRMEDAGVVAVEAECIAEEVLEAVNLKTSIVTFSLGSGNAGDAVFSFVADICGEASEEDKPPKHAHSFGNVGRLHKQVHQERVAALKEFHKEVAATNFPYPETNVTMHDGEKAKFLEALDKWAPTHS
ncbi:ketopantoate hydroxymethyltransferase [Shimia isoporae]|uniref:3-methyl-2-oxobutanoate hydroxymethyltransferase n=1 Tax=Shimia isoporae TaxID=647720 RepID=A0A4R1NCI6_9RHOB|nr:3-methyl-2-oxobutanoate hydroxymethyltransferase [Shimia isoporae]TCL01353.1 ketopantoate hydroxymethyltransferase [Shimia isoporae]